MAVTPVGNPYVESSDLVANYPGASEALAERIDIVGVNPFANAAARDAAIPSPVQGQMCSLNDDNKGYRYDGSEWILFSGAGPANFTNTATGTFSSGGIDYKYITFTGSGDLIVDQAGFADVLVIGGGGGGGGATAGGGGGGGGAISTTNLYLSATTHQVVIGAGGAIGTVGIGSSLGIFATAGGGNGGTGGAGGSGASGGGSGGDLNTIGITIMPTQGNNGGQSNLTGGQRAGGGGGGATGVGVNAPGASLGGNGGAGVTSALNNVSLARAGGGGGGLQATGTAGLGTGGGGNGSQTTGVVGTVNTGGGGGGGATGAAGGSGIVIIRVVV